MSMPESYVDLPARLADYEALGIVSGYTVDGAFHCTRCAHTRFALMSIIADLVSRSRAQVITQYEAGCQRQIGHPYRCVLCQIVIDGK